jgi:hypothetical protein
MKLNISKTRVISFSRKTTTLFFQYKLCHSFITRTDSIKDLGVFIDSELHFHNHAAVGFDVLTICQPSTVWCSRERLPAAAAQPAKVRQSL